MSKIIKRIKLFISLSLIVAIAVVSYKVYDVMSDSLFDTGVDETATPLSNIDTLSKKSESFNALLIGTDASGELTDALMLVNVDKKEKTIRMLSIPRDTKVTVDGKNRKINSCYRLGGLDLLLSEIKELTHAPINYYALIEPGTLASIVDSLGGVEYEVERDMHYSDPVQDLYIDLEKGVQVLNGDQAEQYCRFRSYVMGDLERTKSQQRFFKALFEQKLNLKYVTKLNSLYNAIADNVKTNVSFKDIAENLSVMQMITGENQIQAIETPGTFNDMQKEGISYYLIRDDDLERLRIICFDYFDGTYQPEFDEIDND